MEFNVFGTSHSSKVFGPVVAAVAVDMVEDMTLGQRAVRLLPKDSMRQVLSAINLHDSVTRLCHVTFGFVLTVIRAPLELVRARSAAKTLSRVATVYAGMLWAFPGNPLGSKFGPVKSNTFSKDFRVSKPPCLVSLQALLFIPMVVTACALSITCRLFFRRNFGRNQTVVGRIAGSTPDALASLAATRTRPPIVALKRYQSDIAGSIRSLLGVLFHPLEYTTRQGQLAAMACNMSVYGAQSHTPFTTQAEPAHIRQRTPPAEVFVPSLTSIRALSQPTSDHCLSGGAG